MQQSAAEPSLSTRREIKSVLATVPYSPEELQELKSAVDAADFIHCSPTDDRTISRALQTVDVAIIAGDLDERFVSAPNLKWVHCDHSGLTKSARPEIFERGLLVTGSAGRSAAALAQHAFYFALALTYDAKQLIAKQAEHAWRAIPGYEDKLGLAGKTLGIVGYGQTGAEMAALGKAFQMRVIAYNRSVVTSPTNVDLMLCTERGESIDALVDQSDIIMLATQLTDVTYHMFGTVQFSRMKDTAFIINMARGPVIDEVALIKALEAGEIAGAGLDVFTKEPLPGDSPLWDQPNVLVTPHMTPGLPDKRRRSINMILENIRRYRDGKSLLNALSEKDVFTPKA
ncbi:D-2-hydroxyacid dehydrogenase [Neorhizobium tomejilense]|uniref:D-2-hydroxyacid dehydrogenase n=1 Tax=Neorhizobium tomejilense TaxID=2093828 RepID=UPI003ECE2D43